MINIRGASTFSAARRLGSGRDCRRTAARRAVALRMRAADTNSDDASVVQNGCSTQWLLAEDVEAAPAILAFTAAMGRRPINARSRDSSAGRGLHLGRRLHR